MAEVECSNLSEPTFVFTDDLYGEYLDLVRLSGVTEDHIKEVNRMLTRYKKYILFKIDKQKTLNYLKKIQQQYSISYYKKQSYQILKFLKYLKIEWADDIKLPKNPVYKPQRYSWNDVVNTLDHFSSNPQYLRLKALVLLGASSGLRAEELYQLKPEDIDINSNTVNVNHNPNNGQTTKTGFSRVSFFTEQAREALTEYMDWYSTTTEYSTLFPQTTITRLFKDAPIRVKHLRKIFSQEWDRRGGPTGVKKILMGHSLRNDVDLMHYNSQSTEDLKKIYLGVMER